MKKKYLILLILTIIIITASMSISAKEAKNMRCDYLRVQLGDRIFKVSHSKTMNLIYEGKDLQVPFCPEFDAPPIKATGVSFGVYNLPNRPIYGAKGVGGMRISMGLSKHHAKDDFIKLKKELDEKNIELTDLPVKDDFYIYRPSLIIPIDTDFITPDGNPVVFEGGGSFATTFNFGSGIGVRIKGINRGRFSTEDLKWIYQLLLQSIRSAEIAQ